MQTIYTSRHLPQLEKQRGQVALIILLIMVVVLTIGISIASRTVMDVSLSRQEEQGGRVYQAAESGVENALSQNLMDDSLYTNDSFSGQVTDIQNINVDYTVARRKTLETRVDEGAAVAVDLTGSVAGNQVQINWGQNDDCSNSDPTQNVSSLIFHVLNNTGGVITQRTYSYAACSYTGGYSTAGTTAGDGAYYRKVVLTLQAGDTALRITPVYADAPVQVSGLGWTLPTQYFAISAQARSQIGNETRAIQVNRTLPTYPAVMDYVLYSGSGLQK